MNRAARWWPSRSVSTLTVAALDVGIGGRVGLFFDLAFVCVCVIVALLVRPQDFFTVGVLPPLIMLVVFVVLGHSHRVAIARDSDGLVQAVITGLSHHAVALGAGYAACLVCLAVRDQFMRGSLGYPGTRGNPDGLLEAKQRPRSSGSYRIPQATSGSRRRRRTAAPPAPRRTSR